MLIDNSGFVRAASGVFSDPTLLIFRFADIHYVLHATTWSTKRQLVTCGTLPIECFIIPMLAVRNFTPHRPCTHPSSFCSSVLDGTKTVHPLFSRGRFSAF